MDNPKIIVDTFIFIEYLRKKDKTKTLLYSAIDNYRLNLSSITVFELFAGATTEDKKKDIDLLLSEVVVIPFFYKTAIFAGQIYNLLRKKNRLVEFRDIFIAATTLSNNMPLLTLNKKHFKHIDELKLI